MDETFLTLRERGWKYAAQLSSAQKQIDLAWAAGFFDGEGCIRINKTMRKHGYIYYLQIFVRQVDPAPINKFKALFGGSIQYRSKSNDTINNARAIYTWSTAGPTATSVLGKLYPYLVTKTSQAEIAFDFQTSVTNRKGLSRTLTTKELEFREDCFLKLKEQKWMTYSSPLTTY